MSVFTEQENKALQLLARDIKPGVVAQALGVTPAVISQYLSREEFSQELAHRKYTDLSIRAELDNKADNLQDKLLKQIADDVEYPEALNPMQRARLLSVIASIKRSNTGVETEVPATARVVELNLPKVLLQNVVVNINNQVIKAGNQSLLTIQSSRMSDLAEEVLNHANSRIVNSTEATEG